MSSIHDDDYCGFCGREDETHKEHLFNWICDACCDGITQDWISHTFEVPDGEALGMEEWLKMAYPERIILVEWSDEDFATYTQLAAQVGMSLEEFVVHCIRVGLENYREVNPDVG